MTDFRCPHCGAPQPPLTEVLGWSFSQWVNALTPMEPEPAYPPTLEGAISYQRRWRRDAISDPRSCYMSEADLERILWVAEMFTDARLKCEETRFPNRRGPV